MMDVKEKKVVARLTMIVGQRSCTSWQDVKECEVALRQVKRMKESEESDYNEFIVLVIVWLTLVKRVKRERERNE